MSAPVVIGDSSAPRLARGMRLQFDKQRDQWIIQAPERVFVLDAIAREILQRCTGEATVTASHRKYKEKKYGKRAPPSPNGAADAPAAS